MIRVEVNKGHSSTTIKGSGIELITDTICIVKSIYDSFEDEDMRFVFKKAITDKIDLAFKDSDEISAETEKLEEASKNLDRLKEIDCLLDELLKTLKDKDDE